MARSQLLQNSLITGVVAPTLYGRIDLEKYYSGLDTADNVIIMPHGGVERRPGLRYITTVPTGSRLFSFEFNVDQNYILVLSLSEIKIYKPGDSTLLNTLTWTVTQKQLNEMDIIQSADTVIIVHEDFKPKKIMREGSDSNWSLADITLTNIPKFKYNGTTDEDVWSNTRGWVRTATFHQGRLWFGGSKSKPTSVWASMINDFFNFNDGGVDVKDNNGIFDVLDTDQYNAINNIVSGTKLQILTAGGEFVNTADIITPKSSAWTRYTGYGAKRLKPVNLDGSTFFMDKFGKTVRTLIYDFEEGGYTTPPISILAEHIINEVQDLDMVRGSSISVSNLLYLVNIDGTVAVFNTMRKENIAGWTRWTTQGKFKRVTVTNSVVSFIVERDGVEYLEVLDRSVLLDHSFNGSNVDREEVDEGFGNRLSNEGITQLATSVDRVEVDELLASKEIRVVADGITQLATSVERDGANVPYAVADQESLNVYAGLNYDVRIKTLPAALATRDGNKVYSTKRITKVTSNVYNTRGMYINDIIVTNRKFGQKLDEVFAPFTGLVSTYLLGYNSTNQVEITQKNPDPLTILALDLEISY